MGTAAAAAGIHHLVFSRNQRCMVIFRREQIPLQQQELLGAALFPLAIIRSAPFIVWGRYTLRSTDLLCPA
jgi:hypothetical protein